MPGWDEDDDFWSLDDPESAPGFEDPDELSRIIEEELGAPKKRRKPKK